MTHIVRSATIFSLSAEAPRALLASQEKHAQFDAAFLVSPSIRIPCSLQKLSSAGATLRIDGDPTVDQPLCLELANGQTFEGRVDWCRDGEAGFVFDASIDVIGAIARNLASLSAERRAVPRVEIQQTASLRHNGKVELARTRNLSQGGAGIASRLNLAPGDTVQLTIDGLRPLDGIVRWVRSGQAGIAFDEELPWQILMPWLRSAQQLAPSGTAAVAHEEGLIPDKHAIRLDAPAQVRTGVHWWNAEVRALTAQLVELETRASVMPGTQLWIALPEIGGGPASVIERRNNRILCEFKLPLRPRDFGLLTGGRAPA